MSKTAWLCSALQGAFFGLVLGLLLGLVRLILDFIYVQPRCDQLDERPAVVKDVHYLYFSMILSSVTLITVCAVSWFTEPPSKEMVLWGLTLYPLRRFTASDRKPGLIFKKLKSPGFGLWRNLISEH